RGVERVDVEVAPERVERVPSGRRGESVDALPAPGVASEERVEAPVGPPDPDLELRQLAGPVREPELPVVLEARGRHSVVPEAALPALERPERPVGCPARGHEPGELD